MGCRRKSRFLVTSKRLYKRLCPSIGQSARRSIRNRFFFVDFWALLPLPNRRNLCQVVCPALFISHLLPTAEDALLAYGSLNVCPHIFMRGSVCQGKVKSLNFTEALYLNQIRLSVILLGSSPDAVDDLCIQIWGIFVSFVSLSVYPYVYPLRPEPCQRGP